MKQETKTARVHWYPGAPGSEDTVMQEITTFTKEGEEVQYKDISKSAGPGFFVRKEALAKPVLDALEKAPAVVVEEVDSAPATSQGCAV